jgi:hypothetical protein
VLTSAGCASPPVKPTLARTLACSPHFCPAWSGRNGTQVRIRMFTALLTCERIMKADLEKASYVGESVPSERTDLVCPGRMRHGHGEMRHDCGNTYVGQWENDMRSGEGTYTYACGDVYMGQWKDGKYDGTGRYTGSQNGGGGDSYVGEWQADKPHGNGRYVSAVSGDVYDGEFKDGQYHGKGTYTRLDGHVKNGQWREGLLVPAWQRALGHT